MKEFIETILKDDYGEEYNNIYNNSDLIKYLDLKTAAIQNQEKV